MQFGHLSCQLCKKLSYCSDSNVLNLYFINSIMISGGYDVPFLQRTKASPLELARKRFPRPSAAELNEALTNSMSFLVVREPFERLLSGYRNKLESRRNKYYKILGDQIIKEFRKGGNKRVSFCYSSHIRFIGPN